MRQKAVAIGLLVLLCACSERPDVAPANTARASSGGSPSPQFLPSSRLEAQYAALQAQAEGRAPQSPMRRIPEALAPHPPLDDVRQRAKRLSARRLRD